MAIRVEITDGFATDTRSFPDGEDGERAAALHRRQLERAREVATRTVVRGNMVTTTCDGSTIVGPNAS